MTPDEERLLNDLLERLRRSPAGEIDRAAEAAIMGAVRERPDLPYMMAQTIIMQDFALRDAQTRIQEMERQAKGGGGSFLAGAWGNRGPGMARAGGYGANAGGHAHTGGGHAGGYSSGPWGPPPMPGQYGSGYGYGTGFGGFPGHPGMQGGGFLRSAAATAAGVVGGALLLNSLQGMFGPDVVVHEHIHQDGQDDPAGGQDGMAGDQAFADQDPGVDPGADPGGDAVQAADYDPGADHGADPGGDMGSDFGGDGGGDFGGDEMI
ncbi:MAG TPA: DUF2076 family protein [Azospirillaceae bacterium]|nr:DUF2076 family protein [Azospirillaceae bacterium]